MVHLPIVICSRLSHSGFLQGDGGAIISTSSVHAHRAWFTDTTYGVAKMGIVRLTQSMAVDLGQHGIRGLGDHCHSAFYNHGVPSSSIALFHVGGREDVNYWCAHDIVGLGIRCNTVLPGHMDTDHEFGTPPPPSDTDVRCSGAPATVAIPMTAH